MGTKNIRRKGVMWYPRNPKMLHLFKGYALDNEMSDTGLLNAALKAYFADMNMNPSREAYLSKIGQAHYAEKKG